MAIVNLSWNGHEVIGEKYKIRNKGLGDAVIKQIFINNVNLYLAGTSPNSPQQGFIFYQNLYAFKFYNNPIASDGVVVNNLDVSFYFAGTQIPLYQTPAIQNYNGYPGPMSIGTLPAGAPQYAIQYLSGEGIGVVNANQPFGTYIKLFGSRLRDYYRAPKTYVLRPYDSTGDEIEIFIIFTPDRALRGLYEADLIINHETPEGFAAQHTNRLKCVISDTNILEIDKTLESNIFSIDNIELENNAIFIN